MTTGDSAPAPILEFDPAREAVLEPRAPAGTPGGIPGAVVLCFFQDVIDRLVREHGARRVDDLRSEIGPNPVYALDYEGRRLGVCHPGVGAPLAAAFLEELIARGCRRFVACGGAGVLVPDLAVGHVIVPTGALRDEGTSYHYLPAGRVVEPADAAVRAIVATLEHHRVPYVQGLTWTTDGLYRETRSRLARRVAEGCLAVEMEAAAFFAVAAFRGATLGQLLYAGDDLSGAAWDARGWDSHASGRELLFRLAAEAVLRIA